MMAPDRFEPPEWRAAFSNDELNALHAECFGHAQGRHDWWGQVTRFSLGWACMRRSRRLAGFVNLAWDGGVHAFILDTMVEPSLRRGGLATQLVREAVSQARAAGCEWVHVDFEPQLGPFYFDACGFTPAEAAGLIRLQ
ncbi:MAG TPA: GNAT family N-acetyltransferase [Caulobacteraceae bacterium]|nr:GNAT family N-acetyltransferase [Caulobacteraceae bacterium]